MANAAAAVKCMVASQRISPSSWNSTNKPFIFKAFKWFAHALFSLVLTNIIRIRYITEADAERLAHCLCL